MNCPVCGNTLTEVFVELPNNPNWDEMEVDVCDGGCGGMWFDRFELDKVDEPDEMAGKVLLETDRDPSIEIDHDVDRDCPQCDDIVMMNRFMSVHKQIEVDECGGCAGVWLDAGELEDIRKQFDSEEAREQAFQEHFEEELAPQLEAMETEEREQSGFLKALRFITPTYWIPGELEWGAH